MKAFLITTTLLLATAVAQSRPPPLLQIEMTQVDAEANYYGTFQSHNQKVVATPDGIFLTYSRRRMPACPDNPDKEAAQWRLMRSTDGGKSFSIVLEAVHGTRAPALESDEAGNLYMTHPDWNNPAKPFLFYRFARGHDYSKPTVTTIPDVSCGAKYAMAYDPGRKQLYIAAQYGQLLTVSPEGKLLRRSKGFRQKGPHAATQYPHLTVSPDGVLHLGMTTVGMQNSGKEGYWDIHYMNSPDGGIKWRKLNGEPLPQDPVPDDTGPTDRITLDDEFQVASWLASMQVKGNKVHFLYHGKTMHYLRYDRMTGEKDIALDDKKVAGSSLVLSHISGLLVSHTDRSESPLYCVSFAPARCGLACLISRDHGCSWSDYAFGAAPHGCYATGGARSITKDGYIIGSFTGGGVWFFRIKSRGPFTETENISR